MASHERDLVAALDRIRADRDTESSRFSATVDNVALLRETATQLRHSAIKTTAVSKETRDYFASMADAMSEKPDTRKTTPSRLRATD